MNHIPPQAVGVERHILGGAMLDTNAAETVISDLEDADFYDPTHRKIFSAIKMIHADRKAIDVITIRNLNPELEAALLNISCEVVSCANIAEYILIVKDKGLKRKQIAVAVDALERGYSEEAAKDTQEFMEREIFALAEKSTQKKTLRPIREILVESFHAIDRRLNHDLVGLPTGLPSLDKHLGGMQPSDLIVLGGRPMQGKTSLAGQISIFNAKAGKAVAFFECEMKDRAIVDRALFAEAGINQERLRHGNLNDRDYPKLAVASGSLRGIPFWIDDSAGITPMQIRTKCRRFKQKNGLDLIVIDNIQRMKSDSRTTDLRVQASQVSAALKEIAKEFNVPILAVSHIRRLTGGEGTEPTLSDLQESGNIEQDADVVMLIHRPDLHKDPEPGQDGKAKMIFAKFREGSLGYVDLFFEKTLVTFYDWDSRPTPGGWE